MSLETSNETTKQTEHNQPPKIAKQLIVAAIALAVVAAGVIVATSGKRLVDTSTGCTATLSGTDVRVTFNGPHASSNCSEWIADFDGQHEGWVQRFGDEASGRTLVCTATRGKDSAKVSDTGIGLIGSLACLSLQTDGWEDTTPLDN